MELTTLSILKKYKKGDRDALEKIETATIKKFEFVDTPCGIAVAFVLKEIPDSYFIRQGHICMICKISNGRVRKSPT